MNPENIGAHINYRHTLLLFISLVGSTGISWKSRNNFITTNFSQFKDKGTYRRTAKSAVM